MFPLSLRAALIFPEKLTLAGTRTPAWVWIFALFGPLAISSVFGVPFTPTVGMSAVFVVNIAFIALLLTFLTRNFRRAHPLGRRQLKWVMWGLYTGTVPVLATDVIAVVNPSLWWLHESSRVMTALIPVSICIAILRANFFDID